MRFDFSFCRAILTLVPYKWGVSMLRELLGLGSRDLYVMEASMRSLEPLLLVCYSSEAAFF